MTLGTTCTLYSKKYFTILIVLTTTNLLKGTRSRSFTYCKSTGGATPSGRPRSNDLAEKLTPWLIEWTLNKLRMIGCIEWPLTYLPCTHNDLHVFTGCHDSVSLFKCVFFRTAVQPLTIAYSNFNWRSASRGSSAIAELLVRLRSPVHAHVSFFLSVNSLSPTSVNRHPWNLSTLRGFSPKGSASNRNTLSAITRNMEGT